MSGHTRSPRAAADNSRLTEPELADLLRVAVQQCGRSDNPPTNLPDVVKLATARLGRSLSEVAICQVADAVVDANELPGIPGELDPLVAVSTAVMGAREEPHEALHALLVETWIARDPAPDPRTIAATPSFEDREHADLARLTLAGRYFLPPTMSTARRWSTSGCARWAWPEHCSPRWFWPTSSVSMR